MEQDLPSDWQDPEWFADHTVRQRTFVHALLSSPSFDQVAAAKEAGYKSLYTIGRQGGMGLMTHKYDPDYAVHPGETVKECMEMYGMTPRIVVHESFVCNGDGLEPITMSGEIAEIACGLRSIEQRHAEVFYSVFDVPVEFWLERQRIHDERLAILRDYASNV